jgi:hypothetical protein
MADCRDRRSLKLLRTYDKSALEQQPSSDSQPDVLDGARLDARAHPRHQRDLACQLQPRDGNGRACGGRGSRRGSSSRSRGTTSAKVRSQAAAAPCGWQLWRRRRPRSRRGGGSGGDATRQPRLGSHHAAPPSAAAASALCLRAGLQQHARRRSREDSAAKNPAQPRRTITTDRLPP